MNISEMIQDRHIVTSEP